MKIKYTKTVFTVFISLIFYSQANSQDTVSRYNNKIDRLSVGLGLGLDYGGIGGQIIGYPQKNIGLFAGGGYALIGIGYNLGIKLRLLPENKLPRVVPYFIGMYGYNTAIKVSSQGYNIDNYNKFFYGPSLGLGFDLYPKHKFSGYWSFNVLVPIRGSDVNHYIDSLENYNGVQFKNKPLPVTISIGYHFVNSK
ncbi:MAG TPA: hypothetical protein VMT76_16365 [Puia sp.]|nr:hypothetical protein [Puia sp.]